MSLLTRSPGFEPVTVYPQITVTDDDGNTLIKASPTGVSTVARFQSEGQSGTSSRLQEQEDEGFSSERVYMMRLPAAFTAEYGEMGMASVVEWGTDGLGRPARYSFFGHAIRYGASPRTKHLVYTIKRS